MQRKIINLSVPEVMEKQIQKQAKMENKSTSELLREAFRIYLFYKNWAKIRALGEETALKMGLESYDDIEEAAG